jgi:putative two-component system response regulator
MSLIRTHPQVGYDILKSIDFPWPVAQIIYQHHERNNGSGYPVGIMNGDILIEAKILAVSDVVEAMASHRPYRASIGIKEALMEVEKNRNKLYEADVVDACLYLFHERGYVLE